MTKTKTKPKRDPQAERAEKVRQWLKDNPVPTFEHSAFGVTWQVPQAVSAATWRWLSELQSEGRGLKDLEGEEILQFVVGVIGEDLFDEWTQLGLTPEQIAIEAGAVFAAQNERSWASAGDESNGDETDEAPASDTEQA